MSRKYIGHAGQIAIVFVSLYLLYIVGMDFYLYDVEYSGGSDDARWTIPNEGWDDGNTIRLLWWGFYLFVTGTHLFLYFKRLSSMKEFNVWALPTFDIDGIRILSGLLSAFFVIFVFFFHATMPEVFTPSVSYEEYGDISYYKGIDMFWTTLIAIGWMIFYFFTALHLLLYTINIAVNKNRTNLTADLKSICLM